MSRSLPPTAGSQRRGRPSLYRPVTGASPPLWGPIGRSIGAVVFDLFFTLINPLGRDFAGESEYSLLGMTREDFEARYTADYETWGRGKIRDPRRIMARTLRGLGFSQDRIVRAAEARMERIRRAIYGIEEKKLRLLGELREGGYKTALVSNADAMDIRYWQGSALSRAFDETIFSCEVGLLKPDPRIFTLAAEKLRVETGACLYVGDGGHRELSGARAAGMFPVLTTEYITHTWPEKIEALRQDADRVIQTLDEIRGAIGPFRPLGQGGRERAAPAFGGGEEEGGHGSPYPPPAPGA